MRLFSTCTVVLFFFTFLASGGPIPGIEPPELNLPTIRPWRRTPHTYNDEEVSIFLAQSEPTILTWNRN